MPFAVEQEFNENGFSWFRHALLLAAGDEQQSNAMTIGWGGIGTLWGKTAVTVYVAEKRYTKEFMDRAEYFTVMAFPEDRNDVLEYMGTKSGEIQYWRNCIPLRYNFYQGTQQFKLLDFHKIR